MISLDNLTVSYGGWTLFDNISFLINPKDRIGLVGKNGAGKTTLLRIITGEQQPTSGAVTLNGDCTIGYLPQTMRVADTTTLVEETAKAFGEVLRLEAEIDALTREIAERTDYESAAYEQLLHRLNDAQDHYHILGGETRDADIEKTLLGLGFKRSDFGRATSEFSGGWRMRIELAKLLLRRPSIFLLDEPTNHLDIESIQWLEEYLRGYNGAVLLISHDRAFLDNVTNRTVELSLGKIYDYKVSYSKYVVLRAERRAQQLAAYENQQRMIEKTEEFIEKFRYKPTKSNQVQSRIKQLERLERLEVEEEDLATLNIKFPPAPRSGQIVAEIRDAGMSFGEKHVFSGANFTIGKGDRIALVGRNGEGKTTLARMLVGQLTPTEGSVRLGANVNIGYYAQNQDDLMDGEFTVYDTLDRVAVGDIRTRLRDILGAFLFRGEDIDKKVKVLSGGERARLAMARMMLEPRNLLVLDEPTNHMDMRSKDILKNAIMKYDGTVVVVSHDREFLDGMVEKVYEFRDGGVKEYLGGIYYFLEKRKIESLREIERRDPSPKGAAAKGAAGNDSGAGSAAGRGAAGTKAAAKSGPVKSSAAEEPAKAVSAGKASYEQRKEQEKLLRKLRRNVETIEAELADIEKRIAEYDARFAAATAYDEADYKAYNELKTRYDRQMHEWEKASYELEITEGE
ncbi:ribosomal protection-like ABC-F family protein [Alistipes dispar]|uniref:Probable ATP-binding protein YbiT n=1 Tax=Alistipes dispar TaxID=2585119 RepID=A0A4Y1X4N1_9BACT|nr:MULTISPECIES: ABC-F family ATP-binding cassette domain-containing protein [Alistipes]MBQ4902539.1 ABC-F family ATP-binding cassette domain-containing protein [Alistipes sp. Marseille-P2263]MBS5643615.1 ABC-F family ATP-binding cassette domain-containing protein [Alistipes sp.]MCI2257821.1 ABC-F family ATP-binding cassette domain-containing protein [Alistipes dispar]BBL07278.1 ABC transporter ATP-binding protein [Alistipes dispar]